MLHHVEGAKDPETLANATRNLPGVESVAVSSSVPPNTFGGDKFTAEGMNDQTFSLNFTSGNERYIPTLGVKVRYGRNFAKETPADENRVILNVAALKKIGWEDSESVIGKKIAYPGWEVAFEVVGIVEDFNYWTLQANVEPFAIFHVNNKQIYDSKRRFLAIRISPQGSEAWANTLTELEQLWKSQAGDLPFEYSFVDQAFARSFKSQEQFGKALTVMAGLAILIAGLGLLGMIVYMLEQRLKEIGIRKVSGASVFDIMLLISSGYTKLIALSFVVGAPIAWWMMQQWLQDFAYRIEPSPWIFVATAAGTLITAMAITG